MKEINKENGVRNVVGNIGKGITLNHWVWIEFSSLLNSQQMTSRPDTNTNNKISPGMQQVLATQAQLVQLMTQILANNHNVLPLFIPQLLKSQSEPVEVMTQELSNGNNNPL